MCNAMSTHPAASSQIAQLVQAVQKSSKYAAITPILIEQIAAQELAKGRSHKEALKATKNKLHQIAAVYLTRRPDYDAWLAQLEQAWPNAQAQQQVCRALMANHASTKERLPILDDFYSILLRDLPPIHSLQDLACGLNPLTLPWMMQSGALAADFTYWALDIYADLAHFLQSFFALATINGRATATDILHEPPDTQTDVALLFKAAPCLEQVDKQAGQRLLEQVNARVLFVSFPVHSLSGRQRGMVQNYTAHFHEMVHNLSWRVEQFEFDTELVFRIWKST